jgi:3-oxoacyl-[acyl-carrier protein] reductase
VKLMDIESKKKVFLIMGANGGLGSAVARLLHNQGHTVACAGRNIEELRCLSEELGSNHYIVDATKWDEVAACFEAVQRDYGKIDGVLNAVGSIQLKPAHITREEDWMDVIQTNLSSAFACVKFGAKAMMANGGSIVLISSAAARVGMPNHEAIAAAKGGVAALALSAASTYARFKIRVNCIAPGLMDTKLSKAITQNQMMLDASVQMHPLGRIGTPDDVAPAVVWLLNDESSWVTGEMFGIDGGLATLKVKETTRVAAASK